MVLSESGIKKWSMWSKKNGELIDFRRLSFFLRQLLVFKTRKTVFFDVLAKYEFHK